MNYQRHRQLTFFFGGRLITVGSWHQARMRAEYGYAIVALNPSVINIGASLQRQRHESTFRRRPRQQLLRQRPP
jgi:hypothetical protein